MKLSIIMPAYNERKTIREIVFRLLAVDLGLIEKELIIVDDGSTDGTRDIILELDGENGIRAIFHTRNMGKGAAVCRGMRASTGDVIIIQDADLEYEPQEYPTLLRPILEGQADVVYGSRFFGSPRGHRVLYFWHAVGNRFLTLISNAFTDLNLTDVMTCYKAMTREVVDRLDLHSKRFGIEVEITCKIARLGVRIYEVPISYVGRTYEEGKKIRWSDGLVAVWTILRFFRWEAPKADVGAITPRRMSRLTPYNAWLHARFQSYLGNRVLEVGSGVGNQARFFIDKERVIVSEIERHYLRELEAKFGRRSNVRVASFSFPLTDSAHAELKAERLDTIVCLNVLEHIKDDRRTVADFAEVLPAGGRLVLLVPAMPSLYGSLDVHLNHYRRYQLRSLQELVADAGFEVETIRHLNRPGVLGWWLNARLLKRRVLPRSQLAAFRWILPLLRMEENASPLFGLSLLVLARKK